MQRAGADYVVRLGAKALKLRHASGETFKRAAACRGAERDGIAVVPVVIEGDTGDAPLAGRVIILPLPPAQAEAARRRMRRTARKWGYEPSRDALATAGCLMLITSLAETDWPAQRVLDLYRRRWQVELAFKRLKSLLDLERLRAFDAEYQGSLTRTHRVQTARSLFGGKPPARGRACQAAMSQTHRRLVDLVNAWIHAVLLVALIIELERPSAQSGRPVSPR